MSDEMIQINLKLPENLLEKIDEQVKRRGYSSRQEFIREVLRDKLGDVVGRGER